jgi:predicted DNA-binding transcriptional regulator YafY
MRMFKLTRIRNLVLTDQHFDERRPAEDSSNDLQDEGNFSDVELQLKIMPEMAYRVYDEFDPQNIRRLPDGSFVVSAVLPVDEWMYGYIMSFGEYIEVLGPEHVRESVRKKLECAYNKYI